MFVSRGTHTVRLGDRRCLRLTSVRASGAAAPVTGRIVISWAVHYIEGERGIYKLIHGLMYMCV